MNDREFEDFIKSIRDDFDVVSHLIWKRLKSEPKRKSTLNPAFPFPKEVRIGILNGYLAVEYVGPENLHSEEIEISGVYEPGSDIFDFLKIDMKHLNVPDLGCPCQIMDVTAFNGDSTDILCEYFYDFTQIPNSYLLNGYFDFSKPKQHTVVSNANMIWTDAEGQLKIRHIDFLEIFPFIDGNIFYHDRASLEVFANSIFETKLPSYDVALHNTLNRFIELVNLPNTTEPEITLFIKNNPALIQLTLGTNALNPQVKLEWQVNTNEPDLIPDFLIENMDGYCDILDFKMPKIRSKPVVGIQARRHPSFEIDSAIAQVAMYEQWCSQIPNQNWLASTRGIKILNPRKILIIGHSSEFSSEERRKLRLSRDTIIHTYDEFINLARVQLYRVK